MSRSTSTPASWRVHLTLTSTALALIASISLRADHSGQVAKPAPAPTRPAAPVAPETGDGSPAEQDEFVKAAEETIEKVCIQCHPFENIIRSRRTVREWNDQVSAMAMRGAPGNDGQFAMVKRYLKRYYGLINVNTASADELSAILGFSPKDADAIVKYRDAHGKFADLDALSKVEGIDKTKLEEQPEALRFG